MKLTVYIKTGCPWCIDVTNFLDAQHIPYEQKNVTENPTFFEEMQQKSGQTKAPTFDLDGVIYGDADVTLLKQLLAEKGVLV